LAEKRQFSLRHSHLTPSLGVNPFEFLAELYIAKIGVVGLSVGVDCLILACVVLIQRQRLTDGQTENSTVYRALRGWQGTMTPCKNDRKIVNRQVYSPYKTWQKH